MTGAPKALSSAEFMAESLYVFDDEGVMPASASHYVKLSKFFCFFFVFGSW
jgi:hypothetical protein